jgi:hypothetical protein
MRPLLAALAATLLLAGCGGGSPPDAATSRTQIEQTVLEVQRAIAAGDGATACERLTEHAREQTVESDRKIRVDISGGEPADSCEEAVEKGAYIYAKGTGREMQANVVVDAVDVQGERATATMHTSATLNGTLRTLPPWTAQLRWDDGRWRMD